MESAMIYPNVIIAGAPKCGTTSVFEYLSSHPEVCGSSVKETYFLMDPECPLYKSERNYYADGLQGYRYFFKHCKDSSNIQILLEATPDYMHQKTPLEILPTLPTPPVIFFILRNPSKRVFSLYQFARNNLGILDKSISFSQFISAIKSNSSILGDRPILRNAIEHSKYINYLENWAQRLGLSRIHVFLFEDLCSSPKTFMTNICHLLGINETFYDSYDFERKNATYMVRNQKLHHKKKAITSRLPRILQEGIIRKGLGYLYNTLNTQPGKIDITEEDREILYCLSKEFEPYNKTLAEAFDLDLSSWDRIVEK